MNLEIPENPERLLILLISTVTDRWKNLNHVNFCQVALSTVKIKTKQKNGQSFVQQFHYDLNAALTFDLLGLFSTADTDRKNQGTQRR